MRALEEKGKEWAWRKTKSEKEGKISPFISPRIIKSRPLDCIQWKSTAGSLEARLTVEIKDLFKNLTQRLRFGRDETSRTLMMKGHCASIKGVVLESTSHFPRHHVSSRNETTAPEKADTGDETSRPLIRHSPCHTYHNPARPWHGLEAQNHDLELTVKDSHAWSLQTHRDLELATKGGHAWSQMTQLRPRVDLQRLSCLAPAKSSHLELATKDGHAWSQWRGDDLDLTLNDCHAWSPLSYHGLQLAIKDDHAWS